MCKIVRNLAIIYVKHLSHFGHMIAMIIQLLNQLRQTQILQTKKRRLTETVLQNSNNFILHSVFKSMIKRFLCRMIEKLLMPF